MNKQLISLFNLTRKHAYTLLKKIIQSLESDGFDIDNDKFIIKSKQELAQYKEFYFPTFNMGGGELPTRSELYDEACDRHLKFNK